MAKVSDIPPFGVRMPQELREKLEEAAREGGRSLNVEIIRRLDASVRDDPNLDARLAAIEEALRKLQKNVASLARKVSPQE